MADVTAIDHYDEQTDGLACFDYVQCGIHCALANHENDRHASPPVNQRPLLPETVSQSQQAELLYTPINRSQLRVLRLHPGSGSDDFVLDLSVGYLLHSVPGVLLLDTGLVVEYDALSYCWGEPNCTHSIKCNGLLYPVTAALSAALQRLRYKNTPRWLWIDAICINQHDPVEKSAQVLNMAQIFGRAREVIAWLGIAGQYTDIAASFILSTEKPEVQRLTYSYPKALETDALRSLCEKHRSSLNAGLLDITTRQWFHRVWIKQEYYSARRVTFICGDCAIPRRLLQIWASYCAVEHQTRSPFLSLIENNNPSQDFLFYLAETKGAKCSNPRDYIYGRLGMLHKDDESLTVHTEATFDLSPDVSHSEPSVFDDTNPPEKYNLRVDYTRSPPAVFADVVAAYFSGYPSRFDWFKVWKTEFEFGGQVGGFSLPSWCPNWSRPRERAVRNPEEEPSFELEESPKDNWVSRGHTTSCVNCEGCGTKKVDPLQGSLTFEGHLFATMRTKPHDESLCVPLLVMSDWQIQQENKFYLVFNEPEKIRFQVERRGRRGRKRKFRTTEANRVPWFICDDLLPEDNDIVVMPCSREARMDVDHFYLVRREKGSANFRFLAVLQHFDLREETGHGGDRVGASFHVQHDGESETIRIV